MSYYKIAKNITKGGKAAGSFASTCNLMISHNPLTMAEIAELTGVKLLRTRDHINAMVQRGVIEKVETRETNEVRSSRDVSWRA